MVPRPLRPTLPFLPTTGVSTWLGCMKSDSLLTRPVQSPQLYLCPQPPASPAPSWAHVLAFRLRPSPLCWFLLCFHNSWPLGPLRSVSARSGHTFLQPLTGSFDNMLPFLPHWTLSQPVFSPKCINRGVQMPWLRLGQLLVSGRPWG